MSRPWLASCRLALAALASGLVVAGFGAAAPSAVAAATPMVDLGTASTYAVLSGTSVANTVNAPTAPHTTLRGDLGVKANTQPLGFPPGVVTATKRIGTAAAAQAHDDLVAAYDNVANRPDGAPLALALAGATIAPGLYTIPGAASNTTTVTLDGGGNPNAVFVFQVDGALAFAAGSHVNLINGAQASRVFWQVNGAGAIGANADFAGTLMALNAAGVGAGTLVNGRVFARNGALTLDSNEFYSSPPTVTIAGGSTAYTTDTTPTISGTTDLEAPGLVTVTVNGQTLTATPSAGAWSVSPAILANASYPVVAAVTDAAGNAASTTQLLTVDTVLPEVTIDGGPSDTTNDSTPTIAGTSDVAPGTIVRVTVGSQTRAALVQPQGVWNVRTTALTDGPRAVTASVTDPAGNESSASQVLTIDTAAPAVTITGAANALTNDPTPNVSGTANVPVGTTVTVTLADETLTGLTQDDGAWSVTAADLSDGPHRIVMSVSDPAGNTATFTQWLTVDTVSPVVAITGGATRTTSDVTPTIAGTSNAASGTTVTVSIAGQSMTTLVQPNGTWNATPTTVGVGSWMVAVSAPDPAGNVGSNNQVLTIATDPPANPGGPDSPPPPPPASTPTPALSGGNAINPVANTVIAPNASQKVTGTSLSIGTKVSAPSGSYVVVTASGSVKIKGVKRAIKLTTKTVTIAAGKSTTLKLKPRGTKQASRAASKKIRKAIKKGTKVTATIRLKIVDAAGNRRNIKRIVKLKK